MQKIASVNGVVHMKGPIIAGTIAKETSFSAVQICGWLELIARVTIALVELFGFLACSVVIHRWTWRLAAPLADNEFGLPSERFKEPGEAAEASPTNLVIETWLVCPLMPLNICPKHRDELWRIIICDSIVASASNDAIYKKNIGLNQINWISVNKTVWKYIRMNKHIK